MKRRMLVCTTFVLALSSIFSSCFKDSVTTTYQLMTPIYADRATVLENIKSNAPKELAAVGKLFIIGRYIFVNEIDKGVHVIDNVDPRNPVVVSFINIPGNIDIAVKGNVLFADMYDELVAIDVSDPRNAKLLKTVRNVFPERYYGWGGNSDSNFIISGWNVRDTVVEVSSISLDRGPVALASGYLMQSSSESKGNYVPGIAGSMARFSIIDNYLYAIGSAAVVNSIDISNPSNPEPKGRVSIGMNIETLYPFNGKLFIGSQSGMFIYDTEDPANPKPVGSFEHVRACDPVITDGKYAFVTLRSGSQCQGFSNQLDVLDISDMTAPKKLRSYLLTSPAGLSKDGNTLFICDGEDGLKVFDATDVRNIKEIRRIDAGATYDVIAWNKRLILVSADGIYQYDYRNLPDVERLSVLAATKK